MSPEVSSALGVVPLCTANDLNGKFKKTDVFGKIKFQSSDAQFAVQQNDRNWILKYRNVDSDLRFSLGTQLNIDRK